MFRRALTTLVILSIAALSYQPSFAIMMPAHQAMQMEPAASPEPADMADCPEMQKQKRDCCDQANKQKQTCDWGDACAARCHLNTGIAAVIYARQTTFSLFGVLAAGEPQSFAPERPGPLVRPPIS